MRRRSEIVIVLALGLAIGSLARSGIYLRYVRPAMYPALVVTAVGLVLIAVVPVLAQATSALRSRRARGDGGRAVGDRPGHHRHGRVGWLLVVPVLATLVPPPALGQASVGRVASLAVSSSAFTGDLPPGTPTLRLSEFVTRATRGGTLAGRTVVLEGFSMPSPAGGWTLTRLVIRCCAADALAVQVHVDGVPNPGAGTWARVTGEWVSAASGQPTLRATTIERIAQPRNPYEQ